jgi:uncharacterized protein with von Willebrand factor type A (vWA) domain
MIDVLGEFAAQLRLSGIPVSLTETMDAAGALRAIGMSDRSTVHSALLATMVKNAEHIPAFDTLFEIYFGAGQRPPVESPPDPDAHQVEDVTEPPPHNPFDGLADEDIRDILRTALDRADRQTMSRLAGELVNRHAHIQPGRPVAGRAYLAQTVRAADLDALVASLMAQYDAQDFDALDRRLRKDDLDASSQFMRDQIEAEIRRRLIADRGRAAMAKVLRVAPSGAVSFISATPAELQAVQRAVRPLGRKLATRLGKDRRPNRRGILDFRRTLHKSLSTGGIPVELKLKKRRPAKPDLVVIADVSSSVAASARFTLELLYGIRSQFTRVRVFAFIDDLIEITDLLAKASSGTAAWKEVFSAPGLVRGDGHSDYGHVFSVFEENCRDVVTSRSSVVVLGDARNNYRRTAEREFREFARRARRVYWLNPESKSAWNTGDSVMKSYAPHCFRTVECRNLDQLKAFADSLETARS